jgi:hypothetical protein
MTMVGANIGVGRHYDFIISALFMLSCWRIREEKYALIVKREEGKCCSAIWRAFQSRFSAFLRGIANVHKRILPQNTTFQNLHLTLLLPDTIN